MDLWQKKLYKEELPDIHLEIKSDTIHAFLCNVSVCWTVMHSNLHMVQSRFQPTGVF